MKKILSIVMMLAGLASCLNAQNINKVSFACNEQAVFLTTEGSLPYTVIEIPGATAEELYGKVMYYLKLSNFEADDDIFGSRYRIKYLENERISIETVIKEAYYEKVMGINFDKHLSCRYSLQFRDGRLRIDAPVIKSVITDDPVKKGSDESISRTSFREVVRQFYKDGSVRESKQRQYNGVIDAVNKELNNIIECSLHPRVPEQW